MSFLHLLDLLLSNLDFLWKNIFLLNMKIPQKVTPFLNIFILYICIMYMNNLYIYVYCLLPSENSVSHIYVRKYHNMSNLIENKTFCKLNIIPHVKSYPSHTISNFKTWGYPRANTRGWCRGGLTHPLPIIKLNFPILNH